MNNLFNDHMNSSFKWFVGIIEDRNDPEELGRVKCRCFGVHPSDKTKCSTDDLPWATVMSSTSNANLRGVRSKVHGLAVGSVVVGFFMDGDSAQYPLVLGTIPGKAPVKSPNPDVTYNTPAQTWNFVPNEADVSPLATSRKDVNELHPMVKSMQASRVDKVNCASVPKLDTVDGTGFADSYFTQPTWSQPAGRGGSTMGDYPSTKTEETEAGHVIEVDDSRDNPRLLWYHADGTYQEFLGGGDRVSRVTGNNYEIVFGKNNVLIRGDANITVEGNMRQLVTGNYHLEVYGDYTEKIHGSKKVKISGNDLKEIFGYDAALINADKQLTVNGKIKDVAAGGIRQTVSGDYDITVGGLAPAFAVHCGSVPGLGLIQFTSAGQIDSVATLGIGLKGAVTTIGDPETPTIINGSSITVVPTSVAAVVSPGAIVLAATTTVAIAGAEINLN